MEQSDPGAPDAGPCCRRCFAAIGDDARFCPQCGEPVPVESLDPEVGRVIRGRYKILERIGSGAMGSIFRAEHLALGKVIAIKLLHRHLLSDPTLSRRFHREARAASRIDHPNCISVIDFGEAEDGALFIAMEHVEGRDLASVLFEDHPLREPRICRIVEQVCLALDEAHARGVIHRDLKPENIMVSRRRNAPDHVTVLDFGIAKLQDRGAGGPTTFHTLDGTVCGTPEFMSPEQACGGNLDARSDIYSLGIVLFQLLTNTLPFVAETPYEVSTKQVNDPAPSLSERIEGISAPMEALVMRMLSKSPALRPQTAMAVHDELVRIRRSPGEAPHVRLDVVHRETPLPGPHQGPGAMGVVQLDDISRLVRTLSEQELPVGDVSEEPGVLPPDRPPSALETAAYLRRRRAAWMATAATAVTALTVAVWVTLRPPTAAAPDVRPPRAGRVAARTGSLAPADSDEALEDALPPPPEPRRTATGGARLARRPATTHAPSVAGGHHRPAAPAARASRRATTEPLARGAATPPRTAIGASHHRAAKAPDRGATVPAVIATPPPTPPPDDRRERARASAAAARKAASDREYGRAIELYRAAWALQANPRYLLEIGYAQSHLQRAADACRSFAQFLAHLRGAQRDRYREALSHFGCAFDG